ncbi:hypothetical protein ACFPT7_14470 [Acidicapsa dinghuensis]|uniref:Uncharacterized protein n=1 Tax=Acidicapsa dinghuensis TaxID=2218256 RepID=A0ABW1EI68_9BACT|nr:hypothetical protein [Acidicapsa dinghuensis]
MTSKKSNPPEFALWWLRHMCPGQHNEVLTGDLIERFREGATRGWFWKQTLIASITGAASELRRRWAFFCYAIIGSAAMCLMPRYAPIKMSIWLHWSELPWPLSQFVFEGAAPVVVTLVALSVLAAGLLIEHSFRWTYIFRTWIINIALLTVSHYSIDLFPRLLRPIPGDPYVKVLIIPQAVQVLFLVSTFLVAAWLGCPMKPSASKVRQTGHKTS